MKNLISLGILLSLVFFFSSTSNASCPKNQILKDGHCVRLTKADKKGIPAKAENKGLPAKAENKAHPAKAGMGVTTGKTGANKTETPAQNIEENNQSHPAKAGAPAKKAWEPAPSGTEEPTPANANEGTTAPNEGKTSTRVL